MFISTKMVKWFLLSAGGVLALLCGALVLIGGLEGGFLIGLGLSLLSLAKGISMPSFRVGKRAMITSGIRNGTNGRIITVHLEGRWVRLRDDNGKFYDVSFEDLRGG
ncbi:MAG: hypothetical protein ABII72_01750 [Parcubacteria group bacterium]